MTDGIEPAPLETGEGPGPSLRRCQATEPQRRESDIMTETEDWRTHQQPCFCDRCWCTTLMDLIGERAVLLQAALRDRLYSDGMERDMAGEIIAAIPAARRLEVLTYMLTWDHLQPRVMNVDCLLDECEESSYRALEEMGAILLAEIQAQGNEGAALRILITKKICDPITALVHSGYPAKPGALR